MEHLLRATARAEAHAFLVPRLPCFVTPLLRQAAAGVATSGCSTAAAAPATTSNCSAASARAYGFDLTAVGLQIGREAGRTRLARATVAAVPFPEQRLRRRHVVRRALLARRADRARGGRRDVSACSRPGGYVMVNVAAMESLRGDHSVLSREVRRYSRAIAGSACSTGAGFASSASPTPTPSLFPADGWRSARSSAGAACRRKSSADQEISVPPAPVNCAADRGAARSKAGGFASFDNPFGSSLLCLARKPA